MLASYCLNLRTSECYNSENTKELMLWPIVVIIWVEFSVTLMSGVGLTLGPFSLSLFHVFVRLVLILFPLNNWFVGASIIYVVLCCRVGIYWACQIYPSKTVREVLMSELRGALPEWMFSGGNGEEDDSGANFVEQEVLKQAVFSPLLGLAKYIDCCRSGGSARGSGPCATMVASFLESALCVLTFSTLTFSKHLPDWLSADFADLGVNLTAYATANQG